MRMDLICIFSNDEFGATSSSFKDFVSLLWNTVFLLEKRQESEMIQKKMCRNILILFA
jgi:hypothetical protein